MCGGRRSSFWQRLPRQARTGGEASLIKVYLKVYGRRLIGAALLKLIGEIVFFINPLAVGALTAYVTTLKYPPTDSTVSSSLPASPLRLYPVHSPS